MRKKGYNYSNKLETEPESLKKIGVFTDNEYLFQKIKLEFLSYAEVVRLCDDKEATLCDIVLCDADNPRFLEKDGLRMKKENGDISLPFRIGSLLPLLNDKKEPYLKLSAEEKSVKIGSEIIKLTELEYELLSLLYSKRGAFVSREEILSCVWGDRADNGIINVYIHYLREKLERGGERIILSSRNYGYKISEKYFEEEAICCI